MVLFVAVATGINFGLRLLFRKTAETDRKGQSRFQLNSRTKYPHADIFRFSGQLKLFGIAVAIAVSLLTINWTTYKLPVYAPDQSLLLSDLIDVVPVTHTPPAPIPPPRLNEPDVIEIPVENLPAEIPVVMDTAVPFEIPTVEMPANFPVTIVPPPLRSVDENEPDVWIMVEEMPRFKGCENLPGTDADRQRCTEEKMLAFIYRHLKYPSMARDNRIEGRAIVRFVVDKDGRVSNAEVVRDIGGGCGEEVVRVLNLMNDGQYQWIAGKQRAKPVRVQFTLPVNFKLTH
jgi:protein TonB